VLLLRVLTGDPAVVAVYKTKDDCFGAVKTLTNKAVIANPELTYACVGVSKKPEVKKS
jgi:hypothetical protein